jgi:transcription antitermination protein NusB
MTNRRRSREVVLQMLFQREASNDNPETVCAKYTTAFGEGPLPDAFALQLFRNTASHIDTLDTIIVEASDNWRLERMSRVDRNILRMATFELLHEKETPTKVVINEAVELAKRYGSEESPAFVNGILDRVAREKRMSIDEQSNR